jgi:hypothetical protein
MTAWAEFRNRLQWGAMNHDVKSYKVMYILAVSIIEIMTYIGEAVPHDRHNPFTFFVIFKKCAEVIAHVRTVHEL